MKNILITIMIIYLSACSVAPPIVTPESTPIRITPTITLTPTQTATPEPTQTNTPIPDQVLNEILSVYQILLFTEINANLLQATAEKVNSEDRSGLESIGLLIGMAAIVQAVEEAIDETVVPEMFSSYWEQMIPIHEEIKELIAAWFNNEIDSDFVLIETASLVDEIDQILSSFEDEIAESYGFDRNDMRIYRDDIIEEMNKIFEDEN